MPLRWLLVWGVLAMAVAQPKYPAAPQRPVVETIHGRTITDPYRWLEDSSAPETRSWLAEQTRLTRGLLDSQPDHAIWKQRLTQLMRVDSIEPPVARGKRYFYMQRAADQTRFAIYFREGLQGAPQLLIDPAKLGGETASLSLLDADRDGRLLAYGVREGGADEMTIRFLDVESRKELPVSLPPARYISVFLAPDGSGIWYTELPKAGPRAWFRSIHEAAAKPREISLGRSYGPEWILMASLSGDGRWLTLTAALGSAATQGDVWTLDTTQAGLRAALFAELPARTYGFVADNHVYLLTNHDAPRGRVFRIPLDKPQRHFWKLVLPEAPDNIEGLAWINGKLLVHYMKDAASRVLVVDREGKFIREILLPSRGTVGSVSDNWQGNDAFFSFQSFNLPPTVYRCDVADGRSGVWARENVPFDSTQVEVKQVFYQSKDGTRVPMFVVAKKGLALNGQNPALLTGYGGFMVVNSPYFFGPFAAWVERGGVLAWPGLRGGGEYGEDWHRAGMLQNKQNVFDDFAAAAQWLIANKYTNPAKLSIAGGSNGGLLVGAALTQHPDLFRAVLCDVPLLDMVRYHKFSIAQLWVPEYGSSEDAGQLEWILRYSPYHNVKPSAKYPAVMFVTGDSDTRVDPLHARKMAALLQWANGSENPILLHYDTSTGHSGGLPVTKEIDDWADQLTFLSWQLGGPK